MNVALVGEELAAFVSQHALTRFERTPLNLTLEDADPDCVQALAEAFGWSRDVEERLIDHGFAGRDNTRVRLTVAGALYLLPDPSTELGKAYVEVFRYRDDGVTEDKRYVVRGPLPSVVEETTRRIIEEIGHDVVVLGLRRYELERIPLEVHREAVANAVAHRVYEDQRRSVRIEVRPTSVVITSPGPLPEPVTVETMREQNAARKYLPLSEARGPHSALRFRRAYPGGVSQRPSRSE